ncbi:MAG: hypothetical protein K2I64_02395 [Muribaculaceae bacterium]|nr:hypothetical protein [Muribaculaceae bacterium]
MRKILYILLVIFLGSFTTELTVYTPTNGVDARSDTISILDFKEVRLRNNIANGELDSLFSEINDNPWQLYKFGAKKWSDTIWWEIVDFGSNYFTVAEFKCKYVLSHDKSKIFLFMDDDLLNELFVNTNDDIRYYIKEKNYWLSTSSIVRILGGFIADNKLSVVIDYYAGKRSYSCNNYSDYDFQRFRSIMNDTLKMYKYIDVRFYLQQ